jgi:pimeloyl-ACP methyl ester carboxylesterase
MTLHSQAELVDGFDTALSLHRPLLVGHSLGAAVIGSVALQQPHDVGGVVFADGDGLPIGLGPRWVRAILLGSPFATTALRLGTRWPGAAGKFIRSSCGDPCPAATNALVQQWIDPLDQRSDEHALHDLMLNADYGLSSKQLAAISVPATIIWGSGDHRGGSLSATITNLHHPPTYIIERAGHLTMLADPVGFARAVELAAQRG